MKQATMPAGSRLKVIRDGETLRAYPLSGADSKRKSEQLHNAFKYSNLHGGDVFLYFMSAANVPGHKSEETNDSVPVKKGKRSSTWYFSKIREAHGHASKCENDACASRNYGCIYNWALKPGHEHSTNVEDYMQICRSCKRKREVADNPELLNNRAKPIAQFSLSGEFIRVWASVAKAAQHLRIVRSSIDLCIRGGSYTAGGFKWYSAKYKDVPEHIRIRHTRS